MNRSNKSESIKCIESTTNSQHFNSMYESSNS